MDDLLESLSNALRSARDRHGLVDARHVIEWLSEDGYVIVPKEPTEAMVWHGVNGGVAHMSEVSGAMLLADARLPITAAVYRAMVAASQQKGG